MIDNCNFVERRKWPRFSTSIRGAVRTSQGARHEIEVSDFSGGGCSALALGHQISAASGYSVKIDGLEALGGHLRWRDGRDAGFEFERSLHPSVVEHLARINPPKPADDD